MDLKQQTQAFTDKMLMPVLTGVILPFLEASPMFQASILSAYGMFGVYMQYNQNKLNDFIKILQDNPGIFTQEIVETEEFKDGFLVVMESHLKQRNENKRDIIKKIFLGFSSLSKEEKEAFELERLLDVVNRISIDSVDILLEIHEKTKNSKWGTSIKDVHLEGAKHLESLGLVKIGQDIQISTSKDGGEFDSSADVYEEGIISEFGKVFISYITEDKKEN